MKKLKILIISLLVINFINSCKHATKKVISGADYAIEGVHIISMTTDSILPNQTVFIKGKKILKIENSYAVQIAKETQKIDGKGKFLIPGLSELHAHIPIPKNGNTNYLNETMMLFVAHGITTLRGMKGDIYHLKLKEQTAAGDVIGPRIFTCGARLNSGTVKTVEGAYQIVKEQYEAGFDFIKIHRKLSPELFYAIADAADEFGMQIAGHIPETVGLLNALERNYATVDHFDGYMEALMPDSVKVVPFENGGLFAVPLSLKADLSKIDALVQLTKEKGTWVVPTQAWMERLVIPTDPKVYLREPGMDYVSKGTKQNWVRVKTKRNKEISTEVANRYVEIHRTLLKKMHDAGVGTLFGCDAPQFGNIPGFSMHHEIKAYQHAGLNNLDILKMATVNSAKFLKKTNTFGTIKEGLEADLVLLDNNPLQNMENLKNPVGVMLRGKWLTRTFLNNELKKIATKYK